MYTFHVSLLQSRDYYRGNLADTSLTFSWEWVYQIHCRYLEQAGMLGKTVPDVTQQYAIQSFIGSSQHFELDP